jgi:hypothetical protein
VRKLKKIIIIGIAITSIVLTVILYSIGFFKPKSAGVFIETNPSAKVFIDREQVGRTPFESVQKPGEVVIKLIPESPAKPLTPFETRVNLIPGIKTVIRYEFEELDKYSSGEIISFEKIGKDSTSLSVVTIPDAAQVSIDGVVRGFTPYKTSSVPEGEHQIKISSEGYKERTLQIKTEKSYTLIAFVKLSSNKNEERAPEETQEKEKEIVKQITLIEILDTPTGFLRVRSEPSTLSKEVGQVQPKEKYPLVGEDERSGWYKIEFQKEKDGWVSNRYTRKVEEEVIEKITVPTPNTSPPP